MMKLRCMEHDLIVDDFIGEAEITINELKQINKKSTWITLYEKGVKNADILLRPKFTFYKRDDEDLD